MKEDGTVVIVIDPGHGGETNGGEYGDCMEKDINWYVGSRVAELLKQYDHVEVYLTRQGDETVSLEDRCALADEVDADFMFSLHFNMSEDHQYYGCEFWIPSEGELYARSYDFAAIGEEALQSFGLYSRGIKVRFNSRGTDYYAINRFCAEYQIPSCIIEHCHMDESHDIPVYTSKENLDRLAELDADAIARYFGLKSEQNQKDYSSYVYERSEIPAGRVEPDTTPPILQYVELQAVPEQDGELTFSFLAADEESRLTYYCYSLDGGRTFTSLDLLDGDGQPQRVTCHIRRSTENCLVVRVYNQYDSHADSDGFRIPAVALEPEEESGARPGEAGGAETGEPLTDTDTGAQDGEAWAELTEDPYITDAAKARRVDLAVAVWIGFLLVLWVMGIYAFRKANRRKSRPRKKVRQEARLPDDCQDSEAEKDPPNP